MTLTAHNLSCERNGRQVFSNLNFTLRSGECGELRGANGAGKSSLLRLLAGLVPKSSGHITFNQDPSFAQALHFIAHQDAMKSAMTVAENLHFWCSLLGGTSIAKAVAAFQLERLADEPMQLLSAGQRRRLTLSRLFLVHRPLWLLDEPMTALDATSQATLRQAIANYLADGGIVLAATHGDLGVAPQHVLTLGAA